MLRRWGTLPTSKYPPPFPILRSTCLHPNTKSAKVHQQCLLFSLLVQGLIEERTDEVKQPRQARQRTRTGNISVKSKCKLHQKSKTGNGNMKCLRYNCYFAISGFIITELHHVCHLSSDVNQSEMPKKFSPLDTMRYRAISWERADLTTGAALL